MPRVNKKQGKMYIMDARIDGESTCARYGCSLRIGSSTKRRICSWISALAHSSILIFEEPKDTSSFTVLTALTGNLPECMLCSRQSPQKLARWAGS
jgi:hypothetical protein